MVHLEERAVRRIQPNGGRLVGPSFRGKQDRHKQICYTTFAALVRALHSKGDAA